MGNCNCRNEYMVEIKLPQEKTSEYINLIPVHRLHIEKLIESGKIVFYSLSQDRKRAWVLFKGISFSEIENIVESFPIIKYIDYNINPIAISIKSKTIKSRISLN